MRQLFLIFSLIFTWSAVQPSFANEPPVNFECKPERSCTLNSRQMGKKKECRDVSAPTKELVFYKPEGIWFDKLQFKFEEDILYEQTEYRFAAIAEPEIVRFGEVGEFGDYIFRRTIFKHFDDLIFTNASSQQIDTIYYVCKK